MDGNFVWLVNGIPSTIVGLVSFPIWYYTQHSGKALAGNDWVAPLVSLIFLSFGIWALNHVRHERSLTLYSDRLIVKQSGRTRAIFHSDVAEVISKSNGESGHWHRIILKSTVEVRLPWMYKEGNIITLYRRAIKEANSATKSPKLATYDTLQ